ncbi:MAG: pilus assembly protein N-terminal domain-containing protein, partial [Geminicoccaceae bacterium]
MINRNNTMFGQLEARSFKAIMMVPFMAMALSSAALGQSWELERERGVGGGGPAKAANKTVTERTATEQTAAESQPQERTIIEIIIEPDVRPVIRPAEGRPVEQAGATRSNPPTAAELLEGTPENAIKTEALSALTRPEATPRPAAKPHDPKDAAGQAPIEQAQFAPNAGAQPKAILPPRAGEAPSEQAFAPVIMPSPRKPATVQNALLAPSVGASPKESVLRTAPTPDNALVELVETPSDYSLSLAAGTGQVLNLGKPITNVFVADPNVADVNVLSPTQIIVHGNQLGRTNIFGLGDGGDVVLAIDVDTVPNADVASAKLKAAAPASRTSVSLESGTLVAEGEVSGVGEAIEVANVTEGLQQTEGPTLNNTTIEGSQQVNIRVRFAEVSRNDTFNL